MSEPMTVGFYMYAQFGMTIPNVAPIRVRQVTKSGHCTSCQREAVLLDDGCLHHILGDEFDTPADKDHVAVLPSE